MAIQAHRRALSGQSSTSGPRVAVMAFRLCRGNKLGSVARNTETQGAVHRKPEGRSVCAASSAALLIRSIISQDCPASAGEASSGNPVVSLRKCPVSGFQKVAKIAWENRADFATDIPRATGDKKKAGIAQTIPARISPTMKGAGCDKRKTKHILERRQRWLRWLKWRKGRVEIRYKGLDAE